jgi:negative regulator of flagellin synthesis FlgM
MKVTNNTPPNPGLTSELSSDTAVAKTKATDKLKGSVPSTGGASSAAASGSNVEISDTARMLQKANDIVRQMPDIRADRISELRKKIGDGSYKIDSAAIADRLVDEHLLSDFGKNNL